ncbi:Hsp20/alpha crystallin family protein [Pseudoflavonifractor sp. AF19-9AC]|uniref:Hsp20/alpha crystallin family protein n=1 Tax=Pseudoflavonifractor sp. AF19-9AC TaxID=2292244 RepID=UPI000E492D21|nr:Hsp20/alpha crystallin family protein [Pseudoflavonifractor sp. AF19-9AC]RHR10313.1 Hsp20/alpha crystallin family protein [Pseudoflavonifractor sp. AF19-9AC]
MYSLLPFGRYTNNSLNSLFDDFERSFFPVDRSQMPAFRTDIKDEGDHFLLEADLPGFQKEDIDLHLQDGLLTITAKHDETTENKDENGKYVCRERRVGSFTRSFNVSGIQEDAISASYENGVLKLTLPKQGEPEPQSRKIAIQ